MQRLLIVDGHAILHRAYHALPPLTNKDSQPIGAIYGFLSILFRSIQNQKPTHLVITFDMKEPTFRKKLFTEYQSHRPVIDESMVSQIVFLHEILSKMGITIFELSGYEADDVIGTLAKQAENAEVIIITGDRDILQLVTDKIRVLMPVKGLSESKLFGIGEVEERMGVFPSEIIDLKALIGDPSDNYPGVPGIGPKTAILLIKKYKTIENIYKHIDELQGRVKDKLLSGEESAKMSKQLATIVTNAPIELDWNTVKLNNLDRPDIRNLFEELGFRSLITRLSVNSPLVFGGKNEKKIKPEVKKSNAEQTSLF